EEITTTPPTCPPCQNTCTTNEGTTNKGLTLPPDVPWHVVGDDTFVMFPQRMNWYDGQALCQTYNLNLYHPKNILAVAEYIDTNSFYSQYWLGAKGNGNDQVWIDGEVLTSADPWFRPDNYWNNGTNDCLAFITHSDYWAKGTVLFAVSGTVVTDYGIICG
ncbi:unnamed protein product, partial [Meganyctiphanes norvegica]